MIFLAARVLAVCCCAGLAGAQTCSELACENSPCSSAEYCSGHGVCLETTAAYENQGGGGRWACECLDSDQGAWEGPECEYNLPVCCADDGNCEDGTDDWCCGEHYYCSHDSEKHAADKGGRCCPGGCLAEQSASQLGGIGRPWSCPAPLGGSGQSWDDIAMFFSNLVNVTLIVMGVLSVCNCLFFSFEIDPIQASIGTASFMVEGWQMATVSLQHRGKRNFPRLRITHFSGQFSHYLRIYNIKLED